VEARKTLPRLLNCLDCRARGSDIAFLLPGVTRGDAADLLTAGCNAVQCLRYISPSRLPGGRWRTGVSIGAEQITAAVGEISSLTATTPVTLPERFRCHDCTRNTYVPTFYKHFGRRPGRFHGGGVPFATDGWELPAFMLPWQTRTQIRTEQRTAFTALPGGLNAANTAGDAAAIPALCTAVQRGLRLLRQGRLMPLPRHLAAAHHY